MTLTDPRPPVGDPAMGRARLVAAALVQALVRARAAAAQGRGVGAGARAPAGAARAPVDLCEIVEARGDDGQERSTWIGYRTARVRLAHPLCVLPVSDRRVQVALLYADLVERVGSVPISDISGASGSGRISDGGAVARLDCRFRLSALEVCLTGTALPVLRGGGGRRPIPERAAVDAVVLGAESVRSVLLRFGWKVTGKSVDALSAAILCALARMSDRMGY